MAAREPAAGRRRARVQRQPARARRRASRRSGRDEATRSAGRTRRSAPRRTRSQVIRASGLRRDLRPRAAAEGAARRRPRTTCSSCAPGSSAARRTPSGRRSTRTRSTRFLFDDPRGYCQHFSGAMALLLRMGGVPARVAVGFSPGQLDKASGEYVVRDLDAHSWVEAYFPRYGWVTFDPTPSAAPAREQVADQQAALDRPRGTGPGGDRPSDPSFGRGRRRPAPAPAARPRIVLAVASAALLLVAAVFWRRLRRRDAEQPRSEDPEIAELERALWRTGPRRCPRTSRWQTWNAGWGRPRRRRDTCARCPRAATGPAVPPPSAAERSALRRELAAGLGRLGRLRALWALPPRPRAARVGTRRRPSAPPLPWKRVDRLGIRALPQRDRAARARAMCTPPRCRCRVPATSSPGKASVREALGRALFGAQRYAEAAEEFRAVAEGAPTNDYALFCLGRCLQLLGTPRRGPPSAGARRLPAARARRLPALPRPGPPALPAPSSRRFSGRGPAALRTSSASATSAPSRRSTSASSGGAVAGISPCTQTVPSPVWVSRTSSARRFRCKSACASARARGERPAPAPGAARRGARGRCPGAIRRPRRGVPIHRPRPRATASRSGVRHASTAAATALSGMLRHGGIVSAQLSKAGHGRGSFESGRAPAFFVPWIT